MRAAAVSAVLAAHYHAKHQKQLEYFEREITVRAAAVSAVSVVCTRALLISITGRESQDQLEEIAALTHSTLSSF